MGAAKSVCRKVSLPWKRSHHFEELDPCLEPFPEGLGPFSVRPTSFRAADIRVLNFDENNGGTVLLSRQVFSRSKPLESLSLLFDTHGCWRDHHRASLELRISPTHAVNLPVATRELLGMPLKEEVQFAWVYPASFGWQTSDQQEGSHSPLLHESCWKPGELREDLDLDNVDVSFLTVGGFMYFKPARDLPELLTACAIRFSPVGPLQFSSPQAWSSTWTDRLRAQGRFQPITARKWVAAGARYVSWVRPDELLPDSNGKNKPLAHHGGFAFLFHELEEEDVDGLDRYFEVVGSPNLHREDTGLLSPGAPGLRRMRSLPFDLTSMPPGHAMRSQEKLFAIARDGRWLLVRHLLAEYPRLASAHMSDGRTLLHICAQKNMTDAELLTLLRDLGAAYDACDIEGHKAEDLGSKAFKALVHSVWGVAPDLFDDPAAWFKFMDRGQRGVLEPAELSDALASAYRCDEVGTRWLQSYVNVNCSAGVTESGLVNPGGILQQLQSSEDFACRRQRRTPALFRGGLLRLTKEEHSQLMALAEQLNQLRLKHGWEPGKMAPRTALPLPLPAPSAEGTADPEARVRSARAMLGFTLEQTRELPATVWQRGFRIDFAGQEGLDDGGLTKAWVNEIAYALWADNALFDMQAAGGFFKPDEVEHVLLDDVKVESAVLYRWTGKFVAYALYQRCLMDCRLCPWVFRSLSRAAAPRHFYHSRSISSEPEWPDSLEGEDHMLGDLASYDHILASSLWRVAHEMSEDELRWLDFTCAGAELIEGGSEVEVTPENRAEYVRLYCIALLRRRCQAGLQAFISGFFEVLPSRLLNNLPEEGVLKLLLGRAELSDGSLRELESIVVPGGLIPARFASHPRIREVASWVFQAARAGDGEFRTRLLEFWIGTGRVPLAGFRSVQPRPRLQVMVQEDRGGGLRRIASWPREKLPEGHTCGNELWIALPDSYEELAEKLKLAVENFEAGFAMR